jgi:acyl-CoA-binding protein
MSSSRSPASSSSSASVATWGIAAAAIAVAAAGCVSLLVWQHQGHWLDRSKSQRQDRTKDPSGREEGGSGGGDINDPQRPLSKTVVDGDKDEDGRYTALVTERFQACVERVGKEQLLAGLPQQAQLEYYGLFKQATLGDVEGFQPSPPPLYDLVATAKYKAWKGKAGMSRTAAMQAYIDRAVLLEYTMSIGGRTDDDDDDNYDDGDLEGDSVMDVGGMGNKPSTMLGGDDYMAAGADGTAPPDDDATHPLHVAAREGDVGELERLILGFAPEGGGDEAAASAAVNSVDSSGQTPLHLAADRGHLDAIRALVKAGADVSAQDHDGIGVLQAAVIGGHVECCRLLLEMGADPHQSDHDGDTPFEEARGDAELESLFRGAVAASPSKSSSSSAPPDTPAVGSNKTKVDVQTELKRLDGPISIDFDEDDGDMM